MAERLPGHEEWKAGVEVALDNLVAKNFERLYNGSDSEKHNAWIEISTKLYQKYDLWNIPYNDLDYELKQKKKFYIHVSMETYIMEIFPHELSNSRTYRFVKQYGKLPKQAPKEGDNFELEERIREGIKRKDSNERVRLALQNFNTNHS